MSEPIDQEILSWLAGREILKTDYRDGVLALAFTDGSIAVIYTEVIIKAFDK